MRGSRSETDRSDGVCRTDRTVYETLHGSARGGDVFIQAVD